jgi:hypothetical protein
MFAIRPAAIIACAIGALISTAALPFDNGQWNDVPDQVRPGLSPSEVPPAFTAVM